GSERRKREVLVCVHHGAEDDRNAVYDDGRQHESEERLRELELGSGELGDYHREESGACRVEKRSKYEKQSEREHERAAEEASRRFSALVLTHLDVGRHERHAQRAG